MIPLAVPVLGGAELTAVDNAVRSGMVSSVGPEVSLFEREFAEWVGAPYAVACSSGTAALHVAMRLSGVDAGALVAVSDFTFMASAAAAHYQGAELLLVDSSSDDWCMDMELLRDGLQQRRAAGLPLPRVLEVVHILGQPARIDVAVDLCEEYGMSLVEDAAEALGATWTEGPFAGRHAGTVGLIGSYSFNGNKIMTTGGGGMIVTADPELAAQARHLTTQARVPDRGYLHDTIGYNYRLTNLAAALGRAQLQRLKQFVESKRRIAARYDAAFAGTGIEVPPRTVDTTSTYWLYSILVPADEAASPARRNSLLDHLAAQGVGARALWRPLHDQPPLYSSTHLGGAVGEGLFQRGVSLPCSADLAPEDQDTVIRAVQEWVAAL